MKIIHDIFPAHLSVAPPTYTGPMRAESSGRDYPYVAETRTIVTTTNIIVAVDTPTGAQVIFNEEYDPETLNIPKKQTQEASVTTVSGKRLVFKKAESCGCGSRLRSWNPQKTIYSRK
jgi:hypothetical protein